MKLPIHPPFRSALAVWIVCAIVVPLLVVLAFQQQFETLYFRHLSLPAWETRFGFRYGANDRTRSDDQYARVKVVAVTPGGVFARAGVVPGDIPVGNPHGFEHGFYSDLRRLEREGRVELVLFNERLGGRRSVTLTK